MQSFKNRAIATVGAVVATFATVSFAAPVRAESGAVHVRYADLDLASTRGSATLDRRIAAAAQKVCGPVDALMRFQTQACIQETVARAKANVPSVMAANQDGATQIATR